MAKFARYRSQAVANMVGMPVTTLRVWERRYGLGSSALSAGGHRLYSDEDVRRIALLKQLTQQGHAIGTLTTLDGDQLMAIAAGDVPRLIQSPLRLVVVGQVLAQRLNRMAVAARGWKLLGVYENEAQAEQAAGAQQADVVLGVAPVLPTEASTALSAAAQAWRAAGVGVVFGFGRRTAQAAHRQAGMGLLRETGDDDALMAWVERLPRHAEQRRSAAQVEAQALPNRFSGLPWPGQAPGAIIPPRRYDDAVLMSLAAHPSLVACECPRHVADLLMQLAHFEAYSADCANRDAADAALHEQLRQATAGARMLMEQALEQLARHEGIAL
jgi:MerR family transcriptional regulator, light-induced transcriptional regulator